MAPENVGSALLFVWLLLSHTAVFAGDITSGPANTGFQMLEEPVNPRNVALGNAGTALAGKGFAGYNPALPFLVKKSYLSAEYGMHPKADLKHAQLETAILFERWFMGLSVHSESIDDIYATTWLGGLPSGDVSFSSQFTEVSLDLGFSQWDDLAFAVSVNALQDRIEEEYAYAFTISAGAVFNPVPDRLYCGLSLLNLGIVTSPMNVTDNGKNWGKGERVPFNSRLGLAWKDVLRDIGYTIAFDVVYRNVRDPDLPFTRYIADRFTFPLGIEVRPVAPLALRIGKRINHATEAISFGLGLDLDPLTVDASFVIPKLVDDSEIKWVTGITYYLRKPEKKSKTTSRPTKTETPIIITPDTTTTHTTVPAKDSLSVTKAEPESVDTDTGQPSESIDDETVPTDSTSPRPPEIPSTPLRNSPEQTKDTDTVQQSPPHSHQQTPHPVSGVQTPAATPGSVVPPMNPVQNPGVQDSTIKTQP
jgi:hypothetical protein